MHVAVIPFCCSLYYIAVLMHEPAVQQGGRSNPIRGAQVAAAAAAARVSQPWARGFSCSQVD
jgi:hypothetical protein